jgi:hypothetical protein
MIKISWFRSAKTSQWLLKCIMGEVRTWHSQQQTLIMSYIFEKTSLWGIGSNAK